MKPGWYPDPDDDQARRYWDGESWSAPLPKAAVSAASEPAVVQREPAQDDRPLTKQEMCGAFTCKERQAPGRLFCVKHAQNPMPASEKRTLKIIADAQVRAAKKAGAPAPVPPNPLGQIVCPHCNVRGQVVTEDVKLKRGVSGGKATGAVLTGGLSLFATGLSRKEQHTQLHCFNCDMTWVV